MLNVSEYLDDYDAAPTDILLAIVTELADTMRRKLGVELKDNYFVQRLNEIKEFLLSDVEINEGELALGFCQGKNSATQKGSNRASEGAGLTRAKDVDNVGGNKHDF